MTLKTDYKDDILAFGNLRRYQMIQNNDGTVSFQDVTQYEQTGDVFGAGDINRTNQAVNEKFDSGDVVDPMLTTEPGFAADAYQTKLQFDAQNKNLSVRYNAETDMIQILADNGNWYDFQKAYIYDTPLYSYGNEYADITGGWSNIANRPVNFTKNADNMYSNNSATTIGGIGTTKIIDLTTFKTIKVKANVTGLYPYEGTLGLRVCLLNSDKSPAKIFEMNKTGLMDWSFDISSYNGNYYVEIQKPSANECKGYIYEVKLGR